MKMIFLVVAIFGRQSCHCVGHLCLTLSEIDAHLLPCELSNGFHADTNIVPTKASIVNAVAADKVTAMIPGVSVGYNAELVRKVCAEYDKAGEYLPKYLVAQNWMAMKRQLSDTCVVSTLDKGRDEIVFQRPRGYQVRAVKFFLNMDIDFGFDEEVERKEAERIRGMVGYCGTRLGNLDKHEIGVLDLIPKASAPRSLLKGMPLGSYYKHWARATMSLSARSILYMMSVVVGNVDISACSMGKVMDAARSHNVDMRLELGTGKCCITAMMKRHINNFLWRSFS